MLAKNTGALYTDQTHFLYVGPLIASAWHRHHAGQVIWAPSGLDVHDEVGSHGRVATFVVPPDRAHRHGAVAIAAVLWVDRDDLPWERSGEVAGRSPASVRGRLGAALRPDEALALAQELLELAVPRDRAQPGAARHPAVKRMCALLDSEHAISMTSLARQSGLSARQLRHRFTQEVGINPRAYRRWRRLRRAVAAIERGASLTEAALEAGFTDGAHFSRVFLAMFGTPRSAALAAVRFGGPLTPRSA
jgi:AraC-like DNA-binding protein